MQLDIVIPVMKKKKKMKNKSKCEVCGDQLQRVTYVRKMGRDDIEFEWQDEHQNIATCVIARPELRGRVYKVEPL